MPALSIRIDDRAVALETPRGRLLVDASAHALWVRLPSGETMELGASRAGVHAVAVAAAQLGVDEVHAPEIVDAIYEALARAADHVGKRDRALEQKIFAVRRTPLIYSAAFLNAGFLLDDAARFTACRVAIARVEGEFDHVGDPGYAAADALTATLRGWRKVYLEGGSPKKTMNRALTLVDDAFDPDSVWGLRRVPLSRTPQTRATVELLGALGAHPRHEALGPQLRMVERTDPIDIDGAFSLVGSDEAVRVLVSSSAAHIVAELLAWISVGPKTGLRRSLGAAIMQVRAHVSDSRPTAVPPIPLPASTSVRFLANVDEIVEEGRVMRHCVACRANAAVTGKAFIFHGEYRDEHATLHMDARGRIVEARGPGNRMNPAVLHCSAILTEWARGFAAAERIAEQRERAREADAWFHGHDLDERIWLGRRSVPRGAMPIRTVRELLAHYDRHRTSALTEAYRPWMTRQLERARAGHAWLIEREVAGTEAIAVLDEAGRVVDKWRWAEPNEALAR